MSPLSTEHLAVFLAPSEVLAVRRRGIPRRIVETKSCPVPAREGTDGGDWSGAVAALSEVLREGACRRLEVMLSGHFMRYQLLPWRDDLQDPEEELAAARLGFADVFGDVAATWSIRLSHDAPGIPRLAAAVDAGLVEAISDAAQAAGALLDSLQPSLVAVANCWRRHFDRKCSAWLVVHEENRLSLALLEHGRWQWLRSLRVGADWCATLPQLIDYECLLANAESAATEVLVFAPDQATLSLRSDTPLRFRQLSPKASGAYSPLSDGRFGFAMIG